MITEEEAKEKWCPFIRIHEQPVPGKGPNMYAYNRPGITGSMTCIASECMAWEWNMTQGGINYGSGEKPTEGDCGLKRK